MKEKTRKSEAGWRARQPRTTAKARKNVRRTLAKHAKVDNKRRRSRRKSSRSRRKNKKNSL